MNKFKKIRNSLRRIMRAHKWEFYWWTWDCTPGFCEIYYDGWNGNFNLGFFSISWYAVGLDEEVYEYENFDFRR